ncbi:hypothetical protein PN466_00740 [Roseofilum reptotaenium CS-1145]|uniref:Uncharacterized protein n=1 Tax=Roseofilum reptotaenium AO1-A TaxID=1925591 RepID=A0A1L9QJG1_9CYAN|nr:hypothetical protein [Roseofilum reptotaenium]MDB9515490.1 hypothetical protein [Roseofilum reptotaenium CS-1145]OJJ13965.1 hypothetical protein BI308_25365 [Roseofilum reptotaenium AO1-A]
MKLGGYTSIAFILGTEHQNGSMMMSFWLFLLPSVFLTWGSRDRLWQAYALRPTEVSILETQESESSGWLVKQGGFSQPGLTRFTPANFGSQRLNEHLGWYLYQVALYGPPDVLIVGSSRALQGVDPLALRKAIGEGQQGELSIYNFGINGATVQVVDLLIREILTSDQLPRLILWADGVRAFNSGRSDRTYQSIIESEGYQLLLEGVRPSVPLLWPDAEQCYDIPIPFASSEPSVSLISSVLSSPCLLPPVSQRHQASIWEKALATIQANRTLSDLTPLGFLPVEQVFNPQTYYTRYPRIAGQFDGDYSGFYLQGEQAIALSQLLAYTQRRQIPLIFVNLPLTGDYLDPVRLAYEQEFHQELNGWVNHQRLMMVNLVSPELENLKNPKYFADPSHINQWGAIAVARELAKHANIPWPKPKSRMETAR